MSLAKQGRDAMDTITMNTITMGTITMGTNTMGTNTMGTNTTDFIRYTPPKNQGSCFRQRLERPELFDAPHAERLVSIRTILFGASLEEEDLRRWKGEWWRLKIQGSPIAGFDVPVLSLTGKRCEDEVSDRTSSHVPKRTEDRSVREMDQTIPAHESVGGRKCVTGHIKNAKLRKRMCTTEARFVFRNNGRHDIPPDIPLKRKLCCAEPRKIAARDIEKRFGTDALKEER
jgi:hypothetical protein